MGNFGTIPSNTVLTPGQTVQRKLDDSGWEGITLLTSSQMSAKADLVSGTVPSVQLPSYVDDIQDYANLAAFPGTGLSGIIYVADDTNKTYRWSGSVYIEVSPGPGSTDSVIEGATNLYFTTARAAAAAPIQSVAGRTGVIVLTSTDVGLANVNNTSDANKPVSTAQQTALNAKFTTPSGTTSQYVRGDGTLATLPLTTRTFNNSVSRSLNSAFQASTTQDAIVSYTIDISVTSLLLAGTQGTLTLQYADDSGFTTNVKTVSGGTNSTGGVLNVTNVSTVSVNGVIPAGKYIKIVTANTIGTPTFTYRSGQEVLLT